MFPVTFGEMIPTIDPASMGAKPNAPPLKAKEADAGSVGGVAINGKDGLRGRNVIKSAQFD